MATRYRHLEEENIADESPSEHHPEEASNTPNTSEPAGPGSSETGLNEDTIALEVYGDPTHPESQADQDTVPGEASAPQEPTEERDESGTVVRQVYTVEPLPVSEATPAAIGIPTRVDYNHIAIAMPEGHTWRAHPAVPHEGPLTEIMGVWKRGQPICVFAMVLQIVTLLAAQSEAPSLFLASVLGSVGGGVYACRCCGLSSSAAKMACNLFAIAACIDSLTCFQLIALLIDSDRLCEHASRISVDCGALMTQVGLMLGWYAVVTIATAAGAWRSYKTMKVLLLEYRI